MDYTAKKVDKTILSKKQAKQNDFTLREWLFLLFPGTIMALHYIHASAVCAKGKRDNFVERIVFLHLFFVCFSRSIFTVITRMNLWTLLAEYYSA